MSTTTTKHHDRIEIKTGGKVWPVTFSTSGEYLLSGGDEGVQVWRVRDGQQLEVATMGTRRVRGLAVSKDGKWIAAGTNGGKLHLWDAATYDQIWEHKEDEEGINAVDFSPDSSCFVSASYNRTASVWDIASRRGVLRLRHIDVVRAARYSPQGDRIVTTTSDSVCVYDAGNGHLLTDTKVSGIRHFNTRLLWSNGYILVVSGQNIVQLDVSARSPAREWPAPHPDIYPCIAMLQHKGFVAYSANGHTVSLWNIATNSQFGVIEHTEDIFSIAISPDDRLIAVGRRNGIVIENISYFTTSAGKRGRLEQLSVTNGHRDSPPDSTSRQDDESRLAQPSESNNENHLNGELPSSVPAQPQFDLDEPPSPEGSVHLSETDIPGPRPSRGILPELNSDIQPVSTGRLRDAVKPFQRSSRFTRWLRTKTTKIHKKPAAGEPDPLSEESHPSGPSGPPSRSQPPMRVVKGPSTYTPAQREKRMMARAIKPQGKKSPGKSSAKPAVPPPPNKDAQ